jgi:hypothetical protein
MTDEQIAEYVRLRTSWERACDARSLNDSEKNDATEQATWDALIDYVEANDLNYTNLDPRQNDRSAGG